MFIKKYLIVTSALLALTACGDSAKTASNPTASKPTPAASAISAPTVSASAVPATGKTYRVGTDFTYAPYNQRGQNGIEGLDIDIMNAIAKNQGFQVEYVPLDWESMMKSAKQENLSVVMDGISADDLADNPNYVLSQPYLHSGDCIYVAKPEHAQNWQKNSIAVQPDDFLDDELISEHGVQRTQIKHVKTLLMGLQSVARGESQSLISDCGALRHVAKNPLFKDFTFTETLLPNSETPQSADLGFGVLKDDVELLDKINAGLQQIKQNGELDAIIKKWN